MSRYAYLVATLSVLCLCGVLFTLWIVQYLQGRAWEGSSASA